MTKLIDYTTCAPGRADIVSCPKCGLSGRLVRAPEDVSYVEHTAHASPSATAPTASVCFLVESTASVTGETVLPLTKATLLAASTVGE